MTALSTKLPPELAPPKNCPYCNTPIQIDGAWPFCPNYRCPRRVYGRLQKYVDILDIKGVGIETLLQLTAKGILKTPADLYRLTLEQFKRVERKGEKGYQKLQQGLAATRKMSVAEFFAALDIEGRGTWEAITAVPGLQSVEDILETCYEMSRREAVDLFSQAVRVSPEKADTIISQIKEMIDDIHDLAEFIEIKLPGTKLIGKVFCITGALSMPRPQIEKVIKDAGGQVASSVTARVTHLVCESDSSSSKAKKARQLRVPVITESQLMEMLAT
jgi:DNA ligase (NAD+)